jgi:hypothetical protein
MRDAPRLSWINGKTFVQSNGGRKNAPGRSNEHEQARFEEFERAISVKGSPEETKFLESL